MSGQPDQFLTDAGNWINTAQFNDKKSRDGDYRLIYIGSAYQWQWDTDANRAKFKSLHLSANTLLDNTKYIIAAIVVNHFASAIDAVLQVNKFNKGIRVSAAPSYENGAWGTRVRATNIWGYDAPEVMAQEALMVRERYGITSFKLKVGIDPSQDVSMLHTLRRALPDALLYVDGNSGLSGPDAVRVLDDGYEVGLKWA